MKTYPAEYYYQSIEKYKQRAYETSLELINQAIELDVEQVNYYYHRGKVLQRLQKFEAALRDFDKVILGEEKGQAFLGALLLKIDVLYQQKKYELLITACDQLLEHRRNHWKGFFFRALGLYFTQHYHLAYQDIEMAFYLSNQPNEIRPYRGLICFQVGRFAKAQLDFELALQQKPQEAVLWFNQGMNCYKLNDFAKAVTSFDQAVELGLKNKQLYEFRAKALQKL
jgi:superkiller protein 3